MELAKILKAAPDNGKGKASEKPKSSEAVKEKEPIYDCLEGSVHDVALRRALLRGYEQFKVGFAFKSLETRSLTGLKLTHGSFTSILSTSGQEVLERQLERFFTMWAWSWNLEDGQEFGDHLGAWRPRVC